MKRGNTEQLKEKTESPIVACEMLIDETSYVLLRKGNKARRIKSCLDILKMKEGNPARFIEKLLNFLLEFPYREQCCVLVAEADFTSKSVTVRFCNDPGGQDEPIIVFGFIDIWKDDIASLVKEVMAEFKM